MRRLSHILALTGLVIGGCAVPSRFSSVPGVPSPWPYHRGAIESRGADTTGVFSGKLTMLWQRNLRDKPVGPITLAHGKLFYPSSKRKIKVIDPQTGRIVAQIKTKGPAQAGVVTSDSLIMFGAGPIRNEIVARNMRSGNTRWTSPIKDVSNGSILYEKRLIVGSGDGFLKALDPATGRDLWSVALDGKPVAPPSVSGSLVIQPTDRGNVYAVTADSGRVVFKTKLQAPCQSAAACGELIWIGDVGGTVYALNPSDGKIEWEKSLDGPIWCPAAVAEGRVYVAHSGGRLFALDAATGRDLWSFAAVDVVKSAPLVVGACTIVGTLTGKVWSLRSTDGTIVDSATVTGPVNLSPVTDGKRVYIATDLGRLICFGETDAVNAKTGDTGAVERQSE
ncbi:MAG: PQQ-binding-like beta-propeller repeat protein [candidate division Zixibacteria bacterium]|nr:PQQ-binding-like beta-propeller repeat protein [candidate division Zixibacteria bacterium]